MWVKVRSFPVGGAAVLLAAGLALTGCGNEAGPAAPETSPSATIPSETTSATPESSRSSRTAAPVDSLDELFEAVDVRFDCPGPADGFPGGDYLFVVEGGERLVGRQCGETIVMAWSQDRAQIQSARELLKTAVAPVPVVGTGEWFVADITEAGEGGTGAPEHQAATKDLGRLATELSADFSEG